jgi:hypothetical protein
MCHIAAYTSWHLLEKRALSLKNWTPNWMAAVLVRTRPLSERVKRRIVVPDYSSTHFAKIMRHDARALAAENGDLVTHDIESRITPDHHHHHDDPPAPPPPVMPAVLPEVEVPVAAAELETRDAK